MRCSASTISRRSAMPYGAGRAPSCAGCFGPNGLIVGRSRLCFEIEASSFCHQMVRSIVGLLVEVGMGRRKAGEVTSVLAARNRARRGPDSAGTWPNPVGGKVPAAVFRRLTLGA